MRKQQESYESVKQRITKEKLYNYYTTHTHSETKIHFNLSQSLIHKLLMDYGISKDESLGNLIKRVPKEDIYNYYAYGEHTTQECLNYFNLSLKQLYKILNHYNIKKHSVLNNNLDKIDKEEFEIYYIKEKHTVQDVLTHFNITQAKFSELCGKFNINSNLRYKITKEELYDYYIIQNHSYKDTLNHFNISSGKLNKLISKYNIDKPQSHINKLTRKTCNKLYGVPYHCMTKKCRISNGKVNSKVNEQFAELLKLNNINFEREFSLENKQYDFKVGNYLIEIDPSITHNVNFNPFGDKPAINKYYHKNKSKLAEKYGYKCLHIFDWIDKNIIIKNLYKNIVISPRRIKKHWYNISNHCVCTLKHSREWMLQNNHVEVYDDGYDIIVDNGGVNEIIN